MRKDCAHMSCHCDTVDEGSRWWGREEASGPKGSRGRVAPKRKAKEDEEKEEENQVTEEGKEKRETDG